jgi:hypothetical protein
MRLHEDSVRDFIESPGFGITRQIGPNKEFIELPEADPIPLPPAAQQAKAAATTSAFPESPADAILIVPAEQDLRDMHQDSILDFVNPKGFGFIKDREHVKGFQAHHFHALPSLKESPTQTQRWRIQSLELVSLLKHEEPVAYLSKHLPRMDELRDAPTRPLNPFEKSALFKLQKGDDLQTETTTNQIHMLGSIRAVNQCLTCHRVHRGDLLGAFSYTLCREAL